MPKFIEPEQEQQAPTPAPQGAAGPSGQAAFAVRGNRDDDIKRQEAMDPTEVTEVTEEEQAQYTDFVTRCIACISDSRVPEGLEDAQSPSDAVIKVMSNSSFSVPQALAEGAVSTIKLITDAARRAEKPYSPDVIFHGADEVIAGLYMLGAAAGIFEGASDYAKGGGGMVPSAPVDANKVEVPPGNENNSLGQQQEQPMRAPPVEDESGDFTDDEYALFGEALMLATELFGRKLLDAGQLTGEDAKEAQAFWKQQIAKEVETGQVDDAMFDDLDVESIRNQITKGAA